MHPVGTVVAGLAAVLLVAFSTTGTPPAVLAGLVSVLFALLVALGTERVGTWLVLLGMALAPMTAFAVTGQLMLSDVLMGLGFVFLVPTMLVRRTTIPPAFAVGAFLLLVFAVVSSLLAPAPLGSLMHVIRLISANALLPLAFLLWLPDTRRLRMLAWAYVWGQVASTLLGLAEGPAVGNRYDGATGHPNVLAIGGLMAIALVLYLWHETRHRWLVASVGLICLLSIHLSGSRGALLAVILIGLLYPAVERSAGSALAVIAAATFTLPLLTWAVENVGDEDSALTRLVKGEATVQGSDSKRREELLTAFERFLGSPVIGNGLDEKLFFPHNIFLQVAVAIGILGLGAWLLMLSPFVAVLFGDSPARRLGYTSLAYLAIGMTQPSLWERNVWAALSLALVATAVRRADPEPGPELDPDSTDPPRQETERVSGT